MAQELDDLSRRYVELGFGIERHIAGTVDAYFGPPEIKEAALAGPIPSPADLLDRATSLLADVTSAELSPSRTDYLTAQVRALATTCRTLAGEVIPYRDEVRHCFDIEPEKIPTATYDEAIVALDDALPGEGDVASRVIAWRAQFEVPIETARLMIETIASEVRSRSSMFAVLPDGEGIEISMVSNQPWSGYNWYLGNCRSLIEINKDLPIQANALLDLICHEGYPGHHTEHAIKEQRLYREQGFGEHAIQLINTPECVISEGIATLAESLVFTPEEAAAWRREHLYQPVGIDVDPQRERQIAGAQLALKSVAGNAALLLHEDGASKEDVIHYIAKFGLESPERARHRFSFINDPLWRPYVFTYHVGHDLLGAWIDLPDDPGMVAIAAESQSRRQRRFARLLGGQVTPSAIVSQLS